MSFMRNAPAGAPSKLGRLTSRPAPRAAPHELLPPGLHPLGLSSSQRDGFLFVPASYDPATPAPLLVSLHGAGANAQTHGGLQPVQQFAEQQGLLLLAPDSRGSTWDVIRGGFGPDAAFIDRALGKVCPWSAGGWRLCGWAVVWCKNHSTTCTCLQRGRSALLDDSSNPPHAPARRRSFPAATSTPSGWASAASPTAPPTRYPWA